MMSDRDAGREEWVNGIIKSMSLLRTIGHWIHRGIFSSISAAKLSSAKFNKLLLSVSKQTYVSKRILICKIIAWEITQINSELGAAWFLFRGEI